MELPDEFYEPSPGPWAFLRHIFGLNNALLDRDGRVIGCKSTDWKRSATSSRHRQWLRCCATWLLVRLPNNSESANQTRRINSCVRRDLLS
jgi:hypothetical protein